MDSLYTDTISTLYAPLFIAARAWTDAPPRNLCSMLEAGGNVGGRWVSTDLRHYFFFPVFSLPAPESPKKKNELVQHCRYDDGK